MTTYPEILLPTVQLQYESAVSSGMIRTDVDDNPGIMNQRNRFTSDLKIQKVQWTFTDLQYQQFRAWVFYKISQGADRFSMYLKLGNGLQLYVCRMVNASYKAVFTEGYWVVASQLEIESAAPA